MPPSPCSKVVVPKYMSQFGSPSLDMMTYIFGGGWGGEGGATDEQTHRIHLFQVAIRSKMEMTLNNNMTLNSYPFMPYLLHTPR